MRSKYAFVVGALLALAAICGWIFTYDDRSLPARACLGGYRDRWLLLNALLTYGAALTLLIAWLRPGKVGKFRLIAVHAGLIGPIVVAELLALSGAVDYRQVYENLDKALADHTPHDKPLATIRGETFPDLVYHLGIEAERVSYEIVTDRNGMRNSPGLADPELICVGDSVLVAGLVPTAETVTERLASRLHLRVMNASTDGASPEQAFQKLVQTGTSLDGKIVIQFVFEGNDLHGSSVIQDGGKSEPRLNWPGNGFVKTLLERLRMPKQGVAERRRGDFRAADGSASPVYFYYDGRQIESHRDAIPGLCDFLADTAASLRARGTKYGVVLVPATSTVLLPFVDLPADTLLDERLDGDSGVLDDIADRLASRGVQCLDLRTPFAHAAARGVLPYFPADTHPNSDGHEVMARSIEEWLLRSELVTGERR